MLSPHKNWPSQSFVPYSSASIDEKTSSLDSADFATIRLLIQVYPLTYRAATSAICQSTISRTANTCHLVIKLNNFLKLF
jgi:hypothetical protein